MQAEVESLSLQEQALDERIRYIFCMFLCIAYSPASMSQFQTKTVYNLVFCFPFSDMREKLRGLTEDENNQRYLYFFYITYSRMLLFNTMSKFHLSIRWLYVTEDDIKGLPCFQVWYST